MTEQDGEIEQEFVRNPVSERWSLPDRTVITSAEGIRSIKIDPTFRPVLNKEGVLLGDVLEATIEANPGDERVSLDFTFKKNPQDNYHVLTGGWQSWSSSVLGGLTQDRLVGMKPFDKAVGGQTSPFIEPGSGKEKISPNEGRSYGWICFRDVMSGENLALGVIPSLDTTETIRFKQDGDRVIVTVEKSLGKISGSRNTKFEIFIGRVNPKAGTNSRYVDLVNAFSRELGRKAGPSLMNNRIIGFSWPAYGLGINQEKIEKEVEAGQGIIDTYIIDDGWEDVRGSFTVNKEKFPNLVGLVQEMRRLGIKPGLWIAPFIINQDAANLLPKEWFMKDANGGPLKMPIPLGQSTDKPIRPLQKPLALDISLPEVRKYIVDKFKEFARLGFDVFKADFLSAPFMGPLKNTDKTAVEYYRQIFQEIREGIRADSDKEIEVIGCGAPIMESIGLFEGFRFTGDSSLQELRNIPRYGNLISWALRVAPISRRVVDFNTQAYRDAAAVASRRSLAFRYAHGLVIDGIHLNDQGILVDAQRKKRINEMLLVLKGLGANNLFVGDSLVRVGEEGRKIWKSFVEQFRNTRILDRL